MAHHKNKLLSERLKAPFRNVLARSGYRIRQITEEERVYGGGYDPRTPLPADAAERLDRDHPRLQELRQRYRGFDSPVARHSMWDEDYRRVDLDLRYFRGDNIYVWQQRNAREQARLQSYVYASYLRGFDSQGLIRRLGEDGAFGCFSFEFEEFGRVSRDLLDSVNEIYFLDRHFGLFQRPNLRVLDIGAGYGRMAQRMNQALPQLEHYWCIDAVPESTFLCEYYIEQRGCQDRTTVIPLDQMQSQPPAGQIDLALYIHSFAEMRLAAIEGWFAWLAQLDVKHLMIVPNDGARLLSWEHDRRQLSYAPVLERYGFRQVARERTWSNPDVAALLGKTEPDEMLLFARA